MSRTKQGEDNALQHYVDYTCAPTVVSSIVTVLSAAANTAGQAFTSITVSDLLPHRGELVVMAEFAASAVTPGSAATFATRWAFSNTYTWTAAQLTGVSDSLTGVLPAASNGKTLAYSDPFLAAAPFIHVWQDHGVLSSTAAVTATISINRI